MKDIRALIFDFGDVFINLDKHGAKQNALKLFNSDVFDDELIAINIQYEIGQVSTADFIAFYKQKFPHLSRDQIVAAWNYIIKDFPKYRLDFIKNLASKNKYQLILLSNTNNLHIDYIKSQIDFYDDFKQCFDRFYLSQKIHLRKPNTEIFEFVLEENKLNPENCLFIDDTLENTDSAKSLGFHIWNINEHKEDIVELFATKKALF